MCCAKHQLCSSTLPESNLRVVFTLLHLNHLTSKKIPTRIWLIWSFQVINFIPYRVFKCTRLHKLKCIICSKTQHFGIGENFRMCESPRAQKFLNATLHLQDEVYTKVADLEDKQSVFEADLIYHKLCLELYLQKYMRATAATKGPKKSSGKRSLF